MKSILLSIMCLLTICLSLASCGNEDEKIENVSLETKGATLLQQKDNSYCAEVSHSGGDITFTATGKNKSNGFLSSIKTGNAFIEVTDANRTEQLPYTICNEAWGKVEIVSLAPHTTHLLLNPNTSNNDIDILFVFGGGYKTSRVLIKQLAK